MINLPLVSVPLLFQHEPENHGPCLRATELLDQLRLNPDLQQQHRRREEFQSRRACNHHLQHLLALPAKV